MHAWNVQPIKTMCRTHVPTWSAQGQGRQWCLNILIMYFVSALYILDPRKEFYETLVKCSPYQANVQNTCFNLAGWRSSSQVYRPKPCISCPLLSNAWNFGQIFTLMRHCAKPMFQWCWLKVNATSGGQRFQQHWAATKSRLFPDMDCTITLFNVELGVKFVYTQSDKFLFFFLLSTNNLFKIP
jgi:hypothetical protein